MEQDSKMSASNRDSLNLRFMVFNAENLFLLSDKELTTEDTQRSEADWQKLSTSIYDNKPLLKLHHLARIFKEVDPDIVFLSEVGGLESLANFNRLFLQAQYSPALIEGNSKRHIDVGFLVRKNLPFYFDVVSNKNRPINFNYPRDAATAEASEKFSRDVAELHLFKNDKAKPFFIGLLAHLKSRLDPENIDPNGFLRRQAELGSLIEIYQEIIAKHRGQLPILIAGDFNGNASRTGTDAEFKQIYDKTQWSDAFELANLPLVERATYYQISRNNRVEGRQIDYAFLSSVAQPLLKKGSAFVYRYKDPRGLPADPPSTIEAKLLLPSDHYPLVFEIELNPNLDSTQEGQ